MHTGDIGTTVATATRINYEHDVNVNPTTREFVTGTPETNERLDERPPVYLDDATYGQALDAFVPTCIDVLVFHSDGRVLLGKRQQEPQPDWWVIGGRMRVRESFFAAAARNVKRELGFQIELARTDTTPIGAYSLVWDTRAQAPVFDGCHMLSLPLIYELTEEELHRLQPNAEYAEVAWFDPYEVMSDPAYHPAMRRMVEDAVLRRSRH
jgi:ADP-ribose pyrophosphatase YjhB (NUDIX family)